MSVKRYEWMACDEHACHCDVVESVEGDMVDYDDYAALEARCAALAAENAGLKQTESNLVRNIINDLGDTEFQYSRVHTPATDAFLAEVRAQGVEMFAIEINNLHKQTNQGSYNDYAIKSAVTWATDFAAQLRKGVQS
ncbi:hypothetical protein QN095_17565 [Enterobacter cloacae]|uniref:hypothetical protein n=1 Tax=Enterobacter cloacae TaxID=550 RepID=UPI00254125F0|nr:hypothetical protein [Enterobacter cloacae]WIF61384.1 hypothetical protein QN095_17565 [Enterobacter cloacae]